MSEPFIGQIIVVGFNFAAAPNYLPCDGRLVAISDYEALYNLIGTTYGGDGVSTFGLPNLQSRIPLGAGTSTTGTTYVLGQLAGVENVSLTGNQVAPHSHGALTSAAAGDTYVPGPTSIFADQGPSSELTPPVTGFAVQNQANQVSLSPAAITPFGMGLPHENRQPYQAVKFAIAVYGIYPSPP